MSRGRGGPSNEHYHRHPPPHLQAKQNYYRAGQASFCPRAGPPPDPYSSYYNSPNPTVVPLLPTAPPLITSPSPLSSHSKVDHKPVALNSYNQNHSPSAGPNSFQYQQVEFLRGHSSEAPQFRTSSRGGGRSPSFSYQPQSGYHRYTNPNSSPRRRGGYNQSQSFSAEPRGPPRPRYPIQNQFHGKTHSQYSNRQWSVQTDSLCDNFKSLSFSRDRPNRGEEFDRCSTSSSSANSNYRNVDICFSPDIQDKVHRALAALKPSETICAKLLAKKLRLPKKVVNKALYSLERSQKASKQGLTPPEWTLCRESPQAREEQNPEVQSELSHLRVSTVPLQKPKIKVEIAAVQDRGQLKEHNSDSESSSSYCSSLESSDSEEPQALSKGLLKETQTSSRTGTPDQLQLLIMADQKELILQYLLNTREASALIIAKNVGLKHAKQVNSTLYGLEKQGELIRNSEGSPPTWELSTHCREKMERSLKVAQSTSLKGGPMEEETGLGAMTLPSLHLPSIPGLEPLPHLESWLPEQRHGEAVGDISVSSAITEKALLLI